METVSLGTSQLQTSRIAYGCWRIAGTWNPSEVTPEKEIVWHLAQHDLEGITLAWVTTLQVLPNGHLVIGNCHAGPGNPQLVEVDRNKQVVWTFKDLKHFGDATSNSQVLGVKGTVIR